MEAELGRYGSKVRSGLSDASTFPLSEPRACDHPFAQPRMLCTGGLQEAKASEV